MNKPREVLMTVIVGNWIGGVGHLFLAARVLAPADNGVTWTAIMVMTVLHLLVLAAVRKLADKWAGGLSIVFFLAALIANAYEHLLHPGSNNIFNVAAGDGSTLFAVSVYLLLGLELSGCWLGARLLTHRASHPSQSSASTRAA